MLTILYAVFGYFFLLLTVRVMARRPGGQLTLFEYVFIFLLGGVVIAATAANDRSLTNCTCTVIMVGMLHRGVSSIKWKYPRLGAWIDGAPIVLRRKNEWVKDNLQQMHVAPEDVMAAARGRGIPDISEIEYAVLERSGQISVFEKRED